MEIAKLILRPAGMFSNVNEVVQQLYLAEQNGYKFVIDWDLSCYKDPQFKADPWNYYFEDCFPNLDPRTKPLRHLPGGIQVACTKDNIITPRTNDGNCNPLLLPKDRELPNKIIKRYINLKPSVKNHIDEFIQAQFTGYIIGLHIRGPGRVDGGAPEMRSRFPCRNGIPFEQFFKYVDQHLINHKDARIFACSDSSYVIEEIRQRYDDKVFSYPSTRTAFGEMHAIGHQENAGKNFPRYKLGQDVISETYLLSQTNHFVHGNSNVANFVLCNNPRLSHGYIYGS